MRRESLVYAIVVLLLAAGAIHDVSRHTDVRPWRRMVDFPDFFCAAVAVAEHRDPYRIQPLSSCEHGVASGGVWLDPLYVQPAPQPPLAFLIYGTLVPFGYDAARNIAVIAIFAGAIAIGVLLSALRVPIALAYGAVGGTVWYVETFAGQLHVVLALLAAVGAAVALSRGRAHVAGILAGIVLIVPQVGVPVCVAMLLCVPKARPALLATIAALALVAIWYAGLPDTIEWATRVIPMHARAESMLWNQYSFTYLVRAGGGGESLALALGWAEYGLAFCLALWVASRLTPSEPHMAILAPAALAVTGGTFMHFVELPFAIPLAVCLAASSAARHKTRVAIAAYVILLAVPWPFVQIFKSVILASLILVVLICRGLRIGVRDAALIVSACGIACYLVSLHPPPALPAAIAHAFGAQALAEQAWTDITSQLSVANPSRWLIKLPTWFGLAGTLLLCIQRARQAPTSNRTVNAEWSVSRSVRKV